MEKLVLSGGKQRMIMGGGSDTDPSCDELGASK
jgi:hypothetical protein